MPPRRARREARGLRWRARDDDSSASTSSSIARAAFSACCARGRRRRPRARRRSPRSVRPSVPTTDCAAGRHRTGWAGTAARRRERDAPPIRPSKRRSMRSRRRRRQRREQDRRDGGLVDEHSPPRRASAADMASTTSRPVCSGPVPISEQQRGGDGDAEHHAADQLERLAAALAVRRGEADDRGDRRERRARVVEQQDGEVPRGDGRDRGLEDSGAVGSDQHCLHRRLWRILEPATNHSRYQRPMPSSDRILRRWAEVRDPLARRRSSASETSSRSRS